MSSEENETDWKLKLRYGKLKTEFSHFTVIADGVTLDIQAGFVCPDGKAFMGMSVWASDTEEAGHMIEVIGRQIGFSVSGRIQIFKTEPEKPPKEKPYGYGIKFTPYEE